MSFEQSFVDLMPATVTRKAFVSRNSYGAPSYSTTSTDYAARYVNAPVLIPGNDGINTVAQGTLWIATTQLWAVEDYCSIEGSTVRILEAARFPDEDGAHHVRLRIKGA